ncbi:OPT family oligopeptide transporter [Terriglobus roseus]|uniref:Putative oligopeptide transporter, OPT family n=1 Tax=Terriglobus roseus TaxID=392734 RepID=A0A1G7QI64_9BACT|nr:oligopeptide transporter, OPT family [Terriglobus roseus]SDF98213.1 putative oligopeptide transporter, OPT family [Terriglobus roseus]
MATINTPPPAFKPFVPAEESRPELTVRAILIGALFGILFGAVTVYVGLKAGLTVAASIPISVLSISILRVLGRASILENNIVQTTGNAGQSIASGVIFTLPALIFLGFDLEYARIFALALFGGWIGVLFMIPLRRQLIVEEHGALLYPEGTACADVLIAGERGGSFASRIFLGMGMGSLYTLFQNENLFRLWPGTPTYDFDMGPQHLLKGGSIRADATSEYLGVGYIIGPRVAGIMLAGGVFSWLVLMPAIYFFGSHLTGPLYPGTVPIHDMSPSDLWRTYIRPMGAGAVAAAGCLTLLRTLPTIASALMGSLKAKKSSGEEVKARTSRDLPNSFVYGGSALLVLIMWAFLYFKPVPGAQVGLWANLAASLLIVVFGFLFVTVSARIVGIVGSSASPVSGMTIATLMATAAIFLVQGWTAPAFGALAITVGGVVCIAASNAGDTAQDLKTGFLIGATPWKTQLAVMIGVVVSTFVIGITLSAMNKAFESFRPMATPMAVSLSSLPEGLQDKGMFPRPHISLIDPKNSGAKQEINDATRYELINAIGSAQLEDGKYLLNRDTGKLEIQWVQGIGSEKVAAPQGRLMATVINGILSRKLPWSLVLLGVALVLAVELLGVRSLTLAVGAYLSIATTLAIFVGSMVRWMADAAIVKARERDRAIRMQLAAEALAAAPEGAVVAVLTEDELLRGEVRLTDAEQAELTGNEPLTDLDNEEISPGSLFASGLIAAGGITGLIGVAVAAMESFSEERGGHWQLWRFSHGNLLDHDPVAIVMFGLLAFSLYYFARKPLDTK